MQHIKNTQDILFEELVGHEGNIGLVTLNRPKALNALTHSMILSLDKQLTLWEEQENIKAIVITAVEGRAFCAGGDIRFTYEKWDYNDGSLPLYFRDEYRLNRRIFHYSKPYIALLDGITMGGGVGISIHGSHRVATENLVFAMPETGIGFFPDVGGTYFLPRLPDKFGYYLGITGTRIDCHDCCALGLTQHFVSRASLTQIITLLKETSFKKNARSVVTHILNSFQLPVLSSTFLTRKEECNTHFSKSTIEEILASLDTSSWGKELITQIKRKSPTSLKVTLYQLQQGETLNFDSCMRLEYQLVNRFLNAHDFREGIRAVLIDKDQSPKWQPAEIEAVSMEEVKKYFLPLGAEMDL